MSAASCCSDRSSERCQCDRLKQLGTENTEQRRLLLVQATLKAPHVLHGMECDFVRSINACAAQARQAFV